MCVTQLNPKLHNLCHFLAFSHSETIVMLTEVLCGSLNTYLEACLSATS